MALDSATCVGYVSDDPRSPVEASDVKGGDEDMTPLDAWLPPSCSDSVEARTSVPALPVVLEGVPWGRVFPPTMGRDASSSFGCGLLQSGVAQDPEKCPAGGQGPAAAEAPVLRSEGTTPSCGIPVEAWRTSPPYVSDSQPAEVVRLGSARLRQV